MVSPRRSILENGQPSHNSTATTTSILAIRSINYACIAVRAARLPRSLNQGAPIEATKPHQVERTRRLVGAFFFFFRLSIQLAVVVKSYRTTCGLDKRRRLAIFCWTSGGGGAASFQASRCPISVTRNSTPLKRSSI
jgi:hypothetical protein